MPGVKFKGDGDFVVLTSDQIEELSTLKEKSRPFFRPGRKFCQISQNEGLKNTLCETCVFNPSNVLVLYFDYFVLFVGMPRLISPSSSYLSMVKRPTNV